MISSGTYKVSHAMTFNYTFDTYKINISTSVSTFKTLYLVSIKSVPT
jgi:hypothetical protein